MSILNYINDLFKSLDFPDYLSDYFIPVPYEDSDSCFRYGLDKHGHHSKFIRLRSVNKDNFVCPHCGVSNTMNLKAYVRSPCLILPMVIKDSLLKLNTEDISVIHVILILRMISLLNLKIPE